MADLDAAAQDSLERRLGAADFVVKAQEDQIALPPYGLDPGVGGFLLQPQCEQQVLDLPGRGPEPVLQLVFHHGKVRF